MDPGKNQNRRRFFKTLAAGSVGTTLLPGVLSASTPDQEKEKPRTNIQDLKKFPRTGASMPGKYPGKVIQVDHGKSMTENGPDPSIAYQMVKEGMQNLTGEKNLKKAWRQFVSPADRIGLKINPVAGKTLTTSHEVVKAVIIQLVEEAGMPRENLLIWDRREFQMHETGFTEEAYPGIRVIGTEQKDKEGSFYAKDGTLYGEKMIDKDWYYWAEVNGEYDEYTLPYMVNGGEYSYFSKICTQMVDKIINIPTINIIHLDPDSPNGSFFRHWHTLNDNLESIDRATLQVVGRVVAHVVYTEKS